MPFTDRFIKVPIELIDKKLLEINGDDCNADNCQTYAKINPFEISHYHPQPDKDDKLTKVILYFKNGECETEVYEIVGMFDETTYMLKQL